jgi:dTDP-4-dehydrorhamnose reductase
MRIFLTGATGLLGRYFLESEAVSDKHEIVALSQTVHDGLGWGSAVQAVGIPFEDRKGISDLLRRFSPDWVIHAGGEGNVDRVERQPTVFSAINLEFPLFLMEEASRLRARWATFSSNAIYGGDQAPYSETSEAHPISIYGRFKAQVDAETRRYPGHWVILRPTVSYGWNYQFGRANPVSYFQPLMQQGNELMLVDDQFENPVYAGDVSKTLWHTINKGFQGEINIGGGDSRVSRYDWMRAVARAFGYDQERILPTKLANYPQSGPRPRDTSFDTRKLIAEIGERPYDVFEGALQMNADAKRRRSSG